MHIHAKVDTEANVICPAHLLALPALNMGVELLPPETPPPNLLTDDYCFHINAMFGCIPHEDRDAFACQYMAEEVMATDCLHPCLSGARPLHEVSRLVVPQGTHSALPPSHCWELVEYQIPLEKAYLPAPPYFPQGLIMDPSILIQPVSLTTPLKFPVDMPAYNNTNHECWGGILSRHCHGQCHMSGWPPASVWPQRG
jgi:hypothetical protein